MAQVAERKRRHGKLYLLLMALAALFLLWWAWAGDWNNLSLLSL